MQHNGDGLRDEMAPMIYGMDVQREKKAAQQILFVHERACGSAAAGRCSRIQIEGLELAEQDLLKGDKDDAADIAEKALADPAGDHADARPTCWRGST